MSVNNRVVVGSYWVYLGAVYSDMRKNPKKAVVIAAHNISLSSNSLEELNRLCCIIFSRWGVIGRRFGKE